MNGGRKLIQRALGIGLATCCSAFATNAIAADLGGNCCADLEERIAELEATTARKGNRKVSLTVTGWVSSQLYWFDDGNEKNLYVVDNNNDLSTNVKFTGSAQITAGTKVGYSLALYTNGPSSYNTNDATDNGGSGALSVENSYWWIENDQLGKVSVGHQGLAADNAPLLTDFTGTVFPANIVSFDGGFLRLRPTGGAVGEAGYGAGLDGLWQNFFWCETAALGFAGDCAGGRTNGVRYDTPTLAGFMGSVSWGEDDYWDVALRYSGEFSGFKMAFGTSYSESTDHNLFNIGGVPPTNDNQFFQIGGTIKHLASGLWAHGIWSQTSIDAGPSHPVQFNDKQDALYLKVGLSQKYFAIGQTHIYGEYGLNNDNYSDTNLCATFGGTGSAIGAAGCGGSTIVGSEATRFGIGIVQEIDAASMSFWAKWRRHELDVDFAGAGGAGNQDFDSVDMLLAGAVIFY